MPISKCQYCDGVVYWSWTEAFSKFGFRDGDGQSGTFHVIAVLHDAHYDTEFRNWGPHNTVICSIKKDGVELIPHDDPEVHFGYDSPRTYLPDNIVQLLDEKLPDPK